MKLDELTITRPFPKDIAKDKANLIDDIVKMWNVARRSDKHDAMIELVNKYGLQADSYMIGDGLRWQIRDWQHLKLEKLYTEMSEL